MTEQKRAFNPDQAALEATHAIRSEGEILDGHTFARVQEIIADTIREALSHAEGEAVPVGYLSVLSDGTRIVDTRQQYDAPEVWPLYTHPTPQVAGWRSGYPEYDGDGGVCHIPLDGHPDFMVVAFNRDGNLVDSCGDDVGYSLEDVERWRPIDAHPAPQAAGVAESDYRDAADCIDAIYGASQHCECASFGIAKQWRDKTHGGQIPLAATHPAPQVAVPEGWTDRHTRVTRFALWGLINEGYHRANIAAQKGQPGTAADAAALLDDVKRAEEARNMLTATPTAPAGEPDEIPEIGSQWRHRNGNVYTVESITNVETERPGQYPVTVVYRGEDGKLWSRPAHDWHRSMTFEAAPEQPVSDPDGLPSDWRRVVEGAADMLEESAKQHRGRGDSATAAMCDRFGAMLRDEILSAPAPGEREIARPGYAGVTVWIGDQQCTQVVDRTVLETSRADVLLRHFENARYLLRAGKEGEQS